MLDKLIKEGNEFTKEMDKFIKENYENSINNIIGYAIKESSKTLLKNYSFSFDASNHIKSIIKKYSIDDSNLQIVLNITEGYSRNCIVKFLYKGQRINQYSYKYPFVKNIIPELLRRAVSQNTCEPNIDDLVEKACKEEENIMG